MNHAAKLVLVVLGAVLVLFAVALVVSAFARVELPESIGKSLDVLIVAFVGILAKTGPNEPSVGPITGDSPTIVSPSTDTQP